jgi:hypothetical protein
MSGLIPPLITTTPNDGANLDAFSRARISEPFAVWDNKNIHHENPDLWQARVGVAGVISHIPTESSVGLTVGTASGDFAIRQTSRYHAYVPGKSQLIIMTGILSPAQTGLVQRVGLFDDLNGLFFEHDGTDMGVVIRSDTSGAAVDSRVSESAWNIDKLDGTGPSGVTVDWTKSHIFIVDYQWLGVGRVRFGFDLDGVIFYVHEVLHANTLDKVYMSTPTLPIRYEIRNSAITTGGTLKEICSSVVSEGGYTLPGIEHSRSNAITALIAVTARRPIFAIRLKNTIGGKKNRKTARFLESTYYCTAKNALFEMVHVHDATSVTGTWTSVSADSGVEYSADISDVIGGEQHILNHEVVVAGQAGKGGASSITTAFVNNHSFINQNFESDNSEMIVIYATAEASTSNCFGSIKFIEFE